MVTPVQNFIGTKYPRTQQGRLKCVAKTAPCGRAGLVNDVLIHGMSRRAAAKKHGVDKNTVNLWVQRALTEGNIETKYCNSGRRASVLTPQTLTVLKKVDTETHVTNKQICAKVQKKTGKRLTVRSLRRAKKKLGWKTCVCDTKPYLTPDHAQKRLDFAVQHADWSASDWYNKVFWSDETKGEQRPGRFCIVKPGQKRKKTLKFIGRVSVMMWGGISRYGKTALWHCPFQPSTTRENDMRRKENAHKRAKHRAAKKECFNTLDQDRYIDKVLKPIVLPVLRKHPGLMFMQDNAPCHGRGSQASDTVQFLKRSKLKVLVWPPNSPDLNPIELVWRGIKQSPAVSQCRTREEIVEAYRKA